MHERTARRADDGYLEQRRLDAPGVVTDAAGLLGVVAGYEYPPRPWASGSPPRA